MRVLIYGGRDFANMQRGQPCSDQTERQFRGAMEFLNKLTIEEFPRTPEDEYGNYLPSITVIEGGATGADALGVQFAVVNGTGLEEYKADWETHGKTAGVIRNQQMLDSGIDLAIQFPGGKGTADMRRRLDKAGVRVIEYQEGE